MDIQKYLTGEIKKARRRMNLARLIDAGTVFAAAGGVAGMLCELASLVRPFYHANLAAGLCFGAGLLVGIGYGGYRRADMKQAASRLDSFGLKERMMTAYENMDGEGEIARLQREDALFHYDKIRGRIQVPILPAKRHILALLVSIAAVVGMSLVPSPARDQARLSHQVQEQAKEEQEKLKELLEALDGVDKDSLTEEQRSQLQELVEAMELSREELARTDSWESLASAVERLDYKYRQAAQSLESLAAGMENPGAANVSASALADAETLAKAAANQSGQTMVSAQASASVQGEGNDSGSGGQGSGNDSGNGSGQGGGDGSENGSGQGQGNGSGNGNDQGDGGGSGDGSGQGDGDGPGNGNGQGDGGGQGNGDGSGNGNGQGDGGSSGSGQGQGSGSGSGTGSGRGTGSSDRAHDYVSVPNALADDPSLTGDKNGDQDSDYYRQQNGLAWEGNHVDYGSVIGEYTDNAYEGIANGKYPSGMEPVIRDYFENLNK